MASLRIPEQYKGGLVKLLSLSHEEAQRLHAALESVPVTNGLRAKLGEKFSAIESISEIDANEIADTIMSLYSVLAFSSERPSDLVDDIAEAIREGGVEALKLPEDVRDNIEERLAEFLSIESLAVSIKAGGIMYEYDNVFTSARIFTDIRPVFGLNPDEPPKAATITHMLRLHYYHGADHEEVGIALDEADLGAIEEALDRARAKAESLKLVLEMAHLKCIEPE